MKNNKLTNNTNESLKKSSIGFDPAISCILHVRVLSTTCAISEVTVHYLNVIDEQVNVYSTGTKF